MVKWICVLEYFINNNNNKVKWNNVFPSLLIFQSITQGKRIICSPFFIHIMFLPPTTIYTSIRGITWGQRSHLLTYAVLFISLLTIFINNKWMVTLWYSSILSGCQSKKHKSLITGFLDVSNSSQNITILISLTCFNVYQSHFNINNIQLQFQYGKSAFNVLI